MRFMIHRNFRAFADFCSSVTRMGCFHRLGCDRHDTSTPRRGDGGAHLVAFMASGRSTAWLAWARRPPAGGPTTLASRARLPWRRPRCTGFRQGARRKDVTGDEMLVGMGEHVTGPQTDPPAMLFDLDGTLIDSVYQHVLAWQEAPPGPPSRPATSLWTWVSELRPSDF